MDNGERAATVPITVRQLEAIVRISESLAKMELAMEATSDHVKEAIRMFKVSTLSAADSGAMPGDMAQVGGGVILLWELDMVLVVLK